MIKSALFGLMALVSSQGISTKPVIKKIEVEDPKCYNYATGKAQVFVQGGVAPYQFSLDGKIFQKEAVFKHLKAGDYRVYLKDAAGNLNTSTFRVYQPEKIHFAPTKTTNAGCCNANGAVLVEAYGGKGNFQYQINESEFQSGGYFSGLAGGYTVVAMDSAGCKASLVVMVNDFSGPVIDFINSTEVSCHGGNNGSINVFSIGGSGNIGYSVDGGKTWQKEPVFKNLKAGKYMIKIKDETGCTDSAEFTISQPPVIESNVLFTQQSKKDNNRCIAEVLYSIGGTGTHQYSLDGVNYNTAKILYSNIEKPTVYTRDMAGCVSTTSFEQANISLDRKK